MAGVKNAAIEIQSASNSPLKVHLERESKKLTGVTLKQRPQVSKPLGGLRASEKEKKELKLPNIMDIMDISGNKWKIIQDGSKNRHPSRAARFDSKLFEEQSAMGNRSPPKTPGASVMGHAGEGSHQGGRANGTALNTPLAVTVPVAEPFNYTEIDNRPTSKETSDSPASLKLDEQPKSPGDYLPELEPTCTLAHIKQSPRLTAESIQSSYDEAERKALLCQLNSAVRTGRIPYSEFLKRVSLLAPSFKLDKVRDKRVRTSSMEQAIPELKRQATRHNGDQWTQEQNILNTDSNGTVANTLASSSYTGIYAKEPNTRFPPELQKLYARGGLKVTTLKIDVGESLPENFLTKDKEELRILYPMYDSRVEQEREKNVARINSLQSRDKPQGIYPMRNKNGISSDMFLFPSNSTFPAQSGADDFRLKFKVKRGSDAGRDRDGKIYFIHGKQSISKEGEVIDLPPTSSLRRISGSDSRDGLNPSRNFPRQPPTTPADERRQSHDLGSELTTRPIPTTIIVSSAADENFSEHGKQLENSTTKSLGRIQEDPLDAVSHANTYGTDLHSKRFADIFEESPHEGPTPIEDPINVIFPTGTSSRNRKRVSFHQERAGETDGDDTDFTKSRETLQSIATNEKPSTPDRLQVAYTISDDRITLSDGQSASRGDELKPAVKLLEIDDSISVGTFESLTRRPVLYQDLHIWNRDTNGVHQTAVNNTSLSEIQNHGPVSVSTKQVVFVSPAHNIQEK